MEKYTFTDPPRRTAYPIAKEGWFFIGAAAFATAVFAVLELTGLALIGLVLTVFICTFFRDPDRVIPSAPGAIVSPADGKVIRLETIADSDFFDGECLKISIFMSIFNVHVNRIPFEGRITRTSYHPGKFFSANLDKASRDNEHNAVFLETKSGEHICFVQIAGLVARRIICHIQKGDALQRGQRFGLICFGSRLDVYLPVHVKATVQVGDKVQAGASVIGFWPDETGSEPDSA